MGEFADYTVQVVGALVKTAKRIGITNMVTDEWQGNVYRYHAQALYIQIINNGVGHRTNITTILGQEGLTPPEVEGWDYLISHGERIDFHNSH